MATAEMATATARTRRAASVPVRPRSPPLRPTQVAPPMSVVAMSRDLLFATRILSAADLHRIPCQRIDEPADLPSPDDVDLVVVDWTARGAAWGRDLVRWRDSVPVAERPRVVLV